MAARTEASLGDVGADAVGLHAVLGGDFLGCDLAGGVVKVDDADVPALGGQVVDGGAADAALGDGAGDDCGAFCGEMLMVCSS